MEDYTPVKKMMTEKIQTLYCRGNHGSDQLCGQCRSDLDRAIKHLEACRFKEKGWPCLTCPECCFKGEDFTKLSIVMGFVQDWMDRNPDLAQDFRPRIDQSP